MNWGRVIGVFKVGWYLLLLLSVNYSWMIQPSWNNTTGRIRSAVGNFVHESTRGQSLLLLVLHFSCSPKGSNVDSVLNLGTHILSETTDRSSWKSTPNLSPFLKFQSFLSCPVTFVLLVDLVTESPSFIRVQVFRYISKTNCPCASNLTFVTPILTRLTHSVTFLELTVRCLWLQRGRPYTFWT